MTRRSAFRPYFKALSRFFQIREKIRIGKPFAKLRNDWLEKLPHAEKLAAGLKEEVFV
jgi:hypothetical protein